VNTAKIIVGNASDTLKTLPAGTARTCVTSPPYWGLRDYGQEAQLGLEDSPEAFIENLCLVFDEVWRVLADDGTCWVNIGDSYGQPPAGRNDGDHRAAGKPGGMTSKATSRAVTHVGSSVRAKDLAGIPWLFAFAMKSRGWYLRQDIIWSKPNPMPESVKDRCTKSHEYIFLFSKQAKYFFDNQAIKEKSITTDGKGGLNNKSKSKRLGTGLESDKDYFNLDGMRSKRSVWAVSTQPYSGAHFAVYPPKLILPCVLAGSAPGDTVLDPFSGSGTTGEVALLNDRNYVGVELNPDYAKLSEKRITDAAGMFGTVEVIR